MDFRLPPPLNDPLTNEPAVRVSIRESHQPMPSPHIRHRVIILQMCKLFTFGSEFYTFGIEFCTVIFIPYKFVTLFTLCSELYTAVFPNCRVANDWSSHTIACKDVNHEGVST